ncbi:antimicrobial peptide NK-lysin-like [Sinocyclocheilus anshuiensis]|uniref:Antimicrobial peptide NK-lysin-like n=1 Tax=Sinocyclocheilus anshuiensis TaxID=1608454 RepID=A0A671PB57_9TELE|nr:PREDICTED: antimicrobial peptide NK-lysin-like [Sinocyclocheilus anshuiensis]
MLRNIFLVSLLVYAVCAVHWEIREVDSAEDQDEEIFADDEMMKQSSVECSICKSIMKRVKMTISSNATPDEIKTKLNNTCEKIRLLRVQCKHFVQKYLHDLIDELMTDDGPKTICTKIHICEPESPIKEIIFVHDQANDNF